MAYQTLLCVEDLSFHQVKTDTILFHQQVLYQFAHAMEDHRGETHKSQRGTLAFLSMAWSQKRKSIRLEYSMYEVCSFEQQ